MIPFVVSAVAICIKAEISAQNADIRTMNKIFEKNV